MKLRSEVRAAVLRALEPPTALEIAQRIGFSRQAVYWALWRLEKDGLAVRKVLEPDGGRPPYGWTMNGERRE